MKKWLCMLLSGLILLSLCACSVTPDASETLALCKSKVETAQQVEWWYIGGMSDRTTTLPSGTSAALLNGEAYTLDYEYYLLIDDEKVITADALKQQIESVYTTEFANEHYYSSSIWVEYEGNVYHIAAEGMIPEPVDPESITDVKKDEDTITFRIKLLFEDTERKMKLTYVDGDWKFDELV